MKHILSSVNKRLTDKPTKTVAKAPTKPQSLEAKFKALAAQETAADVATGITELMNLLESRLKVVGITKSWTQEGHSGSTSMYMTRASGGDSRPLRMVLLANGFTPVTKAARVLSFSRSVTNLTGGTSWIEVTIVSGNPDVIVVCVYPE